MMENKKTWIYIHPEATPSGTNNLFGSMKEEPEFQAPTLMESIVVDSNWIDYASEGETMVFEDMTIEIKHNPKSLLSDEEILARDGVPIPPTAEECFEAIEVDMVSLSPEERSKLIAMIYNHTW